MTVGEALEGARGRLLAMHAESARLDAVRLLESALGRDAAWLLAHDRDPISPDTLADYEASLRRRASGEPVAYIVGSAGFYGRTFGVSPDVLIPRPETEQLAELAIAHLRSLARPAPTLCDVGTGTGALALTVACELPAARCTALDVSGAALAVAARNAETLGVGDRVAFVRSDLLAALPRDARFDCIVANLPYVPTAQLAPAPDPTSFEPRLALDGGADGLALYRRLFESLAAHAAVGCTALLEAAPDTSGLLGHLATAAFPTTTVRVHHDYSRRPRLVAIVWPR